MKRFLSLFVSVLCAVGAWAEEPLSGEYVDLGLSVKWATCNLGATSSTDAGWYLAWGETSPKTNYTLGTYLSDLGGTMASYEDAGTEKDPLKEYVYGGANYSEGIGGTAYDAATAALGTGYRMPTLEEFEELANADNCEWVWYDEENDEFNGVAGYKVTSKKDGYTDKYIFLPAAGYRDGENLGDEGSDGNYWSSTPDTDYADGAYNFFFDTDFVIPDSYNNRHFGFTVRPVYAAAIAQITIGEETTKYTDVEEFMDAFSAIDGKATVKLLDDITLSEEWQFENTNADADITLDLNGHNIIGSIYNDGVIYKKDGKLTIEGDGIVENIGEGGDAVGSGGTVVINEGTYIGVLDACFVTPEATIVINGGKFKAPNLYYGGDCINPIVKGGLFSMDPSDCLAVGYEVVENDDEETKGEYPYKVVELDVDITNPAGLLAVPQAGELDIKAYFTAPQEMMYSFVILHGEYRNLNDAIENSSQEDVVYGNMKPKRVATVPQAISVKDANIALEDGETYTIVVYGNPVILDGQGSMFEIAIIPFTVGVGEINTIETISVAAGKLDIKASFSVSDEDLEAGATYMYALFEGKYASFIQLMSVEPEPVIDSEKITIKSDTENITLSSDEVELEAGKDYTLLIFDPTRKDPATGGGYPVVYAFINYTAVDNSTPTAIEGIDAPAAQKAVKTIENGKIVIIKNGEKYDLAGRKL